jgi:flagellin-specific chaperone FliS
MEDNLPGKEKYEGFEPTEEMIEFETTSRTEYISSAYYAIAAVSELDTELMSEEDKRRKKNILRKSLRIIDNIISELDSELFDDFEEDDD